MSRDRGTRWHLVPPTAFREKCAEHLKQKLGVSAAIYTQTTDVEGEVNALMTYDRKFIKVEPATLREMNAPLTGGK